MNIEIWLRKPMVHGQETWGRLVLAPRIVSLVFSLLGASRRQSNFNFTSSHNFVSKYETKGNSISTISLINSWLRRTSPQDL